ncbi:WLM domain-containing protein [Delphinella strobiligena]|nr:WLM domain-containing protein [Delphinella strobiligena]
MNKVLGFERINERRQRPNKLINFIKPLKGPDEELAQDFLERVAAMCYPIMKNNHVVVMSLEEYPSNKEFLGRNFNAGEIIQLVLKAPSGNWYPFKHVQMVMMHELAHCKQMNHSRAFWKVNNSNRDELKELWARKYTGEGLWGRGQTLLSGRYSNDHMPEANDVPENLCGGTYRSRGGKKRKKRDADKPQLTYAERKQRRIAKKFGVKGQALGEDGLACFELDQGRHRPGKPRVANSKRGRELRVAAALARFGKPKEDVSSVQSPTGSFGGYDDDDDHDSDLDGDEEPINRHWDENDNVIKICEDGDLDDGDAQREMDDLREIDRPEDTGKQAQSKQPALERTEKQVKKQSRPALIRIDDDESTNTSKPLACEVCSFENEVGAATCVMCAHVLDTNKIKNSWQCHSAACAESVYRNFGDYGRCYVCQAVRPDMG